MTRKKRRPVRSIDKLSDDLKGQRALKGSKQLLAVTTSTLDRWISKASTLEESIDRLRKEVIAIGSLGERFKELEAMQKRLRMEGHGDGMENRSTEAISGDVQ